MQRRQIAELLSVPTLSPEVDQIFASDELRDFFLYAYHKHFFHEDNTGEMLRSDLQLWHAFIDDYKITGEHNAAVQRQKNPNRKPPQGKEFRVKDRETWGQGLMPTRLHRFLYQYPKEQAQKARKERMQKATERFEAGIASMRANANKKPAPGK